MVEFCVAFTVTGTSYLSPWKMTLSPCRSTIGTEYIDSWALVIGVNNYEHVPPLGYACDDTPNDKGHYERHRPPEAD